LRLGEPVEQQEQQQHPDAVLAEERAEGFEELRQESDHRVRAPRTVIGRIGQHELVENAEEQEHDHEHRERDGPG